MNFRLEEELMVALETIKKRDGMTVSDQLRRALQAWIASKGIGMTKATRRAAVARRRD